MDEGPHYGALCWSVCRSPGLFRGHLLRLGLEGRFMGTLGASGGSIGAEGVARQVIGGCMACSWCLYCRCRLGAFWEWYSVVGKRDRERRSSSRREPVTYGVEWLYGTCAENWTRQQKKKKASCWPGIGHVRRLQGQLDLCLAGDK